MSESKTKSMPKTAKSAPATPEAEPVGDFAAAASAPPKRGLARRALCAFAPVFAAALCGAALALTAQYCLSRRAPAPIAAIPSAPPIFATAAEKKLAAAQLEALFAEKARLLAEQEQKAEQNLRALAAEQKAAFSAPDDTALQAALENAQAMSQRLDNLQAETERRLAALEKAQAGAENRSREILYKTDALAENIAALAAERRQAEQAALKLPALQNLQAALASGAPYAQEWAIFAAAFPQALAEAPDTAAALAQFRQSGLPNSAALASRFAPLADRLAAEQAGNGAGWWQAARRAVAPWLSARPQGANLGANTGADCADILARMEAAMAQGNTQAALAAAAALPPAMQGQIRFYADALRLHERAEAFFRLAAQSLFAPAPRAENTEAESPAEAEIGAQAPAR